MEASRPEIQEEDTCVWETSSVDLINVSGGIVNQYATMDRTLDVASQGRQVRHPDGRRRQQPGGTSVDDAPPWRAASNYIGARCQLYGS
ncbi:hypothetical protein HYQ44_007083 [Verticillium longisporum]|nr:hypothetical protein HYQ44_007083 [Verticillium longisporum]